MSHAFIRESDEQWLDQIPPTLNALIAYLTRENNGVRVYEKKRYMNRETDREVYEMSNGLAYAIGSDSKWYTVEDK